MSASPTVLITGGSSGIGYELATLFARDRVELILVARQPDVLQRAADALRALGCPRVTVLAHDLSQPGAAADVVAALAREHLSVDVLINNAGFATYGAFLETSLDAELQLMQVNMVALTHLTKLLLPAMVARGRGRIMNVASTAAFQPGPLMAVYYASKAYVLSFSEALAEELRGTGVTVTALCPGMTRSGFQERAGLRGSRLLRTGMMDAATVARIGYRGLLQGRPVVIPGFKNRLLVFFVRLTPRALVPRIVRWLQART